MLTPSLCKSVAAVASASITMTTITPVVDLETGEEVPTPTPLRSFPPKGSGASSEGGGSSHAGDAGVDSNLESAPEEPGSGGLVEGGGPIIQKPDVAVFCSTGSWMPPFQLWVPAFPPSI
ncbi:hypothetical protein CTI12_AA582110 [Artemisia annua]|uniref:Uncharacterized protein n=1 Tax=Artemisia annua TaxID=35608 RepID=A0A2U1KNK4_ARTAN|nr:hypothetical protein CTI12_AA582110 [Artemisia annua]